MTGPGEIRPGADPRLARAVSQLATLAAAEAVPLRVRGLAEEVAERLSAPVRLSIVGAPEAGPVQIANALLVGEILPTIAFLPPAEVAFSPVEAWHLVTETGDTLTTDAEGFSAHDPMSLALLRRVAPLPLLQQMSLRVVALDGDADEMRGALSWATREADMLLWCTDTPDDDAPLFPFLPEVLMDHAFLATRGALPASPDPFVAALRVGSGAAPLAGAADLRSALMAHLSQGRHEDLDFALSLLDQHLPRQDDPGPEVERSGPAHQVAERSRPMVAMPADQPAGDLAEDTAPCEQTRAGRQAGDVPNTAMPNSRTAPDAATQIANFIAAQADDLADILIPEGPLPVVPVLERCTATLSDALDMASQPTLAASEDLVDVLAEAADLMFLIEMEGSSGAATDALALMVQARQECEARIAA